MTRLLAAATVAGLLGTTAVWSAQQQTFRATADVVIVDVSVRQSGQPVSGLTAADFVVTDNGIRQDIERVEASSVPLDLTIVTDVSYKHAEVMTTLRADLTQLGATLRPFDRIRVLVFDDHVREVVPFQPATQPVTFAFEPRGHQASLADAIIMALATPVEPDRRHVVILRTRGTDTISMTAISRVRDVAASSDAQLHVIFDEITVWQEMDERAFRCGMLDRCLPVQDFWQPYRRVSQVVKNERLVLSSYGLALEEAAVTTGGRVHFTEVFNAPTVRSTFERVFELFRESYVLRYTPKGVVRDGWHDIGVTAPGHRRAVVRARRGYGVDPLTPIEATRLWLDPGMAEGLRRLVTAYDTKQYAEVARTLAAEREPARLIAALKDAGNPWPTEALREAVFAIELAETVVFSGDDDTRTAGFDLLHEQATLLRHPFEADEFERYWHWSAVAIAQGTLRATEARRVVEDALLRFPQEPRFALARAISADQEWTFRDPRAAPRGGTRPSFRDAVDPFYREAMAHAPTADEARVRLAWGLHRLGDYGEAISLLQQDSGNERDAPVAFLRHLFTGHSLTSLGRHADAIAAYRQAVLRAPNAQSARVSLMNILLLTGKPDDRVEAEALAETTQTDRTAITDPWWTYWQGDYRFYPGLIRQLRERRR
jgi:VWFA-related protein